MEQTGRENPRRGKLKEQVRQFPDNPGVYIMKDRKGKTLYVGKAKNLKKRVSSYFTGHKDIKTRILVDKIDSLESIVTNNEYEALLLENNLIKMWAPRYNINLKDGKSYPVIRVTSEDFPRVFRTRKIIEDGSSYFGPYPSAYTLDTYLELVNRRHPLRKCRGPLKPKDSPCLYYHIRQCSAPCAGKISREDYAREVEKVKEVLAGDAEELEARLIREMEEAAGRLEFERAAEIRDSLEGFRAIQDQQGVVDFEEESRDFASFILNGDLYTFAVFHMRGGKLIGRDMYRTQSPTDPPEAFLNFLVQYYSRSQDIPVRLFLSMGETPAEGVSAADGGTDVDQTLLSRFFENEKGLKVELCPAREKKDRAIMNMLLENARQDMARRLRGRENLAGLEELKKALELSRLPRRIEGFDIAQLSGKYPVASLVSFHNGRPDKSNYRYFRLKTLAGAVDDYESIREAVARRYTRVLNEELPRPDLILIDGGKGQVAAAKGILDALGLEDVPLAGLAKQNEEIFLPGRSKPLILPEASEGLRVLQAVRDETHRFATSLNKRLRLSAVKAESLESVPGIGPVRSRKLLTFYGSLEAIAGAPAQEVAETGGFSLKTAEALKARLEGKDGGPSGEKD